MSFRYSPLERTVKTVYRKFFPVQKSSYTIGQIDDICSVNLVPPAKLNVFFKNCIARLQVEKGLSIGDYLEFGVFNGSSIGSMVLASKEIGIKMRYFGFDAFQGLPKNAEKEDDGVWKKGFYACSFEQMQECLRRRGVDPTDITWVKGWYEKTLTSQTFKKVGIKQLGIVFIDCDTYSSSKAVLDFIGPLIKEKTILCFDDWKLNDLDLKGMGEYQSFNEFLEANPQLVVEEIKSYNRKSRSFLVWPK